MDILIVAVLLLLAIVLILLEIFLLPGVTFAAIGGGLFAAGGILYAYSSLGTMGGNIALAASVIIFILLFLGLMRSKAIDKIGLKTDIDSTVADDNKMNEIKEGMIGITVSRLNPIGKVKIGDKIVEAKIYSDFIDEGVEVVVVKVYPTQIIVQVRES